MSMWVLPADPSGGAPRKYRTTQFNETGGHISPDSHRVAYQSDESGQWEVYLDRFPEPREKVSVSTGGGIHPLWSADANELLYASPDSKLISVAIEWIGGVPRLSKPSELFHLPITSWAVRPFDAASDGKRFLVSDTPERLSEPLSMVVNWPALL